MDDDKTEETSLMDDLAAAWEAEEPTEEEAAEVAGIDEPSPLRAVEQDEEQTEPVAEKEEETEEAEDLGVAPKGLSPAAREAWAETPEAVRAELSKREKDFEKGIQKYAEQAKRAEMMDRALAPYQNLFAMNGGANNTLPGLLQTANNLQTGSDHVRAQTVANIIQQFGVPVATLADILEGKVATRQAPKQPDIQAEIQKALQPIFQSEQQRQMATIQSEIQAFASNPENEFYSDVRNDMADLMDIASKNGKPISMKEAYDKACWLRDDIRQILQRRQSTGEVGARRKASVSISGAPRGHEAPPEPNSTREYLEQAWDMVGKRV